MTDEKAKRALEEYERLKQGNSNQKDWQIEKKKQQDHKDYVLRKRFTPYKKSEYIIRLLPPIGGAPMYELGGSFYSVRSGKRYDDIWSPLNENSYDPIHEKKREIFDSYEKEEATEKIKELNLPYLKTYYFIPVIDRDFPDQGVKLWKIPFLKKGQGILDNIMTLVDEYGLPWDVEKGYDVKIKNVATSSGNSYKFSTLLKNQEKPLSANPEQIKNWLEESENLKWGDIYTLYEKKDNLYVKGHNSELGENRMTHVQFLELVLEGRMPYYSKEEKTFVIPDLIIPVTEMPDVNDGRDVLSSFDTSSGDMSVDDDDLPF